jgi:hypothetical protein
MFDWCGSLSIWLFFENKFLAIFLNKKNMAFGPHQNILFPKYFSQIATGKKISPTLLLLLLLWLLQAFLCPGARINGEQGGVLLFQTGCSDTDYYAILQHTDDEDDLTRLTYLWNFWSIRCQNLSDC